MLVDYAIFGLDHSLTHVQFQAIIWTNGMLLIRLLQINLSEILIQSHTFSFKKNAFENVCKN